MHSATSSIPGSRVQGSRLLGAAILAAAAAALFWWTRPPSSLITAGQLLALLPAGSTMHSLARLNLDGAPPLEAAAVVGVPRFPGERKLGYVEVVARYNRWWHRLDLLYREPLPGLIPISVDAGRVVGDREAVLFQALGDDGRWTYRVVGMSGARVTVLAAGESVERVRLSDPVVIAAGEQRALAWNGSQFVSRPLPAVTLPPATMTWRFRLRNGAVAARTNQITLQPRQTLRIQAVGGGTTPIVIADPRLDVVENGFRARQEGVYSIRVLAPYTPTEDAYVLTVTVAAGTPP